MFRKTFITHKQTGLVPLFFNNAKTPRIRLGGMEDGRRSSLDPCCRWEGSRVKPRLLRKTVNKRNPGHSAAAPPLLSRPGARNGKSLSLSLFPATSCIVIVEVFHAPVGADKSRGRSPQAFPAMIATPFASGLIKGPIRALNGRPLRGHPH